MSDNQYTEDQKQKYELLAKDLPPQLAFGGSTANISQISAQGIAGLLPLDFDTVLPGAEDLLIVLHRPGMSQTFWLDQLHSWVYEPGEAGFVEFTTVGSGINQRVLTGLVPVQVYQVVRWVVPPPNGDRTNKWRDTYRDHMTAAISYAGDQGSIEVYYRWMSYYDSSDVARVTYMTSDPVRNANLQPIASVQAASAVLPPIPGQKPAGSAQSGGGYVPSESAIRSESSSTFWGSNDNERELSNV